MLLKLLNIWSFDWIPLKTLINKIVELFTPKGLIGKRSLWIIFDSLHGLVGVHIGEGGSHLGHLDGRYAN